MGLFVEYHLIQNFVPSNLNRDDTGSPKDAIFGGFRRARISSQCFKRAIRLHANNQKLIDRENEGIRTRKLLQMITELLPDRDPKEAEERIETALSAAGLKLADNNKTEYLLFLGNAEVAAFANLVNEHWNDLAKTKSSGDKKSKKEVQADIPSEIVKKAKALLNGGKAVDIALFGRMLADLPEVNIDAACQVAHAISTHRVDREFDYFTAVDDVASADETGAGMIGQLEFNSATFYRYAVVDFNKLLTNLKGDKDLAISALEAFTYAIACAIPSGKQNTFAAHNPPSFVGVVIRNSTLLNLCNAFETPIVAQHDKSLTDLSVEALANYERKLQIMYGNEADTWSYLDLTGCWLKEKGEKQVDILHLSEWAKREVAQRLGA